MKINILLFGNLSEISDGKTIQVEGVHNLEELETYLKGKYPALKDKVYKVAVNETLINNMNKSLGDGDEVALLPPFAGG